MKLSTFTKFILGVFGIFICITVSTNAQPWTKLTLPDNPGVYCLLPTTGTTLYAGTAAGLYRSENNGDTWTLLALQTRTVQSLAVKGTMMFAGLASTGVQRSVDNGITWTESSNGLPTSTIYSLLVRGEYIFAATNGDGIFISSDNGNSWTPAGSFPNPSPLNKWVYTLALSGSTIYAGTFGDGIFQSTDNGALWTSSSTGLTPQAQSVKIIYPHGTALYAGTQGGGSFRSLNSGSAWTDISVGLGSVDIKAITVGGVSNSLLIVGTNGAGAYRSNDSGKTWKQFIENLNDLEINTLSTIGLSLFAGTNSGVFRASLDPSGVDEGVPSQANGLSVFPQPFGNAGFSVKLPAIWSKPTARLMLSNILGEKVMDMELSVGNSEYIFVPTSNIPSGVYILRAQSGNESVTQTIIKE